MSLLYPYKGRLPVHVANIPLQVCVAASWHTWWEVTACLAHVTTMDPFFNSWACELDNPALWSQC